MQHPNLTPFQQAMAKFDALNGADPTTELINGTLQPSALLYAQRMTAMLSRYEPYATQSLQLAARCQHIERWKIPRQAYPMTKPGYFAWRNALKAMHAGIASTVLESFNFDADFVARVAALVGKKLSPMDAEAQMLEDVVVLVFLEDYLTHFVENHADYDAAKFSHILQKTFNKMSLRGRQSVSKLISLPAPLAPLVHEVLSTCAG